VSDDQTFRIVLLAGAVLFLPVAIYHRIKSQATGERLDRWQEGPFILFTLRPVGIASMIGIIAYMINPSWMAWSSVPLPAWLRWIGAVAGIVAGGLVLWAFRSLGPNLTDTVVTRKAHTLVTRGPYQWVRHPFYDAVALFLLANALLTANWFVFVTGGLALALIVVRTRTEEEHLLRRFGDSYAAYTRRTGRFLPRIYQRES
jgi:protein-S-isoprenylcysteine O-methyltransferase Ste14